MPTVILFLSGLLALVAPGTLMAQNLSDIFSSQRALEAYQTRYAEAGDNKAFAQSLGGAWAWTQNRTKPEDAIDYAISRCEHFRRGQGSPCVLVDLNGELVAPDSPEGYYMHYNEILEVYRNHYMDSSYHKAFAISETSYGMRRGFETEQAAIEAALEGCYQNANPGDTCRIIDINGRLQDH